MSEEVHQGHVLADSTENNPREQHDDKKGKKTVKDWIFHIATIILTAFFLYLFSISFIEEHYQAQCNSYILEEIYGCEQIYDNSYDCSMSKYMSEYNKSMLPFSEIG